MGQQKIKLGWITTWNTKCGIASYSSYLIRNLPPGYTVRILASKSDYVLCEDDPDVIRCWEHFPVNNLDDLEKTILDLERMQVVVIQFQFAFFHLPALGKLVEKLHARGVKTIIFFHATQEGSRPKPKAFLSTIKRSLALADRLLVHGEADLRRLQELSLAHNSELFPHGVHEIREYDIDGLRSQLGIRGRPVLATNGFLMPHKGTTELIDAFPLVLAEHPRATLLLLNAIHPHLLVRNFREQCLARIDSLGMNERIRLINDYLDDDESLCLLGSADLIVYPYQQTSESASGAIRFGLTSHRPVAITPLDIFQDVRHLCHVLPGVTPPDLASGINYLLKNPQVLDSRKEARQHWLMTHSWRTLAGRLDAMIQTLTRQDTDDADKSYDSGLDNRRVA